MSSPAGVRTRDRIRSSTSSEARTAGPRRRLATNRDIWHFRLQRRLKDRLLVVAVRGDHHRPSPRRQWIVRLLQPKDLLAEEAMRAKQRRGDRGVTEHGHDRQWNRRLEEDLESAARQARVVHGHHAIVVVDTNDPQVTA